MELGSGVSSASIQGSTSSTIAFSGTSLAAPIAATLGVLMKQTCGSSFGNDERQLRAMMMTAAWSRNAEGWRYSTPGVVLSGGLVDHEDGAGITMAANLARFCPGNAAGSPNVSSGRMVVDLFSAPSLPALRVAPAGPPPGDPGASGTPPSGSAKSLDPSRYVGAKYWTGTLNALDRVRTTFAWDGCLTGTWTKVAVDFDVLLCQGTRCLYGSRSIADNNEGFDVTVDASGQWDLWYVFPAPVSAGKYTLAYGCQGSGVEPAAWAVAWGGF
jgi:hypothetical protein